MEESSGIFFSHHMCLSERCAYWCHEDWLHRETKGQMREFSDGPDSPEGAKTRLLPLGALWDSFDQKFYHIYK